MGNAQVCNRCEQVQTQQYPSYSSANRRQPIIMHPCRPTQKAIKPICLPKQWELPPSQNTQKHSPKASTNHQANSSFEQSSSSEVQVPQSVRFVTGKGTVKYSQGWVYEGDLVRGIRQGQGRMSWQNGDYYEGRFENGKAHGLGVFQVCNGVRYEGQFVEDDIVMGKRISADKLQIYEGGFRGHQFQGYGVLTDQNQFQYRGFFKHNEMEGQGQITYIDGSSYKGAFKAGKKHGFGVWQHNKCKYEGYWREGQRHGEGIFTNSNLEKFRKNFQMGREVA